MYFFLVYCDFEMFIYRFIITEAMIQVVDGMIWGCNHAARDNLLFPTSDWVDAL